MKPYFNISNFLDGYNALLAGWTLLLAGIFGAYWYLFAALLLFNVLDWLSGWYKARRLHEESSKVGLQGVMKKLCYWILIAVAFTAAAVFEAVGQVTPNLFASSIRSRQIAPRNRYNILAE